MEFAFVGKRQTFRPHFRHILQRGATKRDQLRETLLPLSLNGLGCREAIVLCSPFHYAAQQRASFFATLIQMSLPEHYRTDWRQIPTFLAFILWSGHLSESNFANLVILDQSLISSLPKYPRSIQHERSFNYGNSALPCHRFSACCLSLDQDKWQFLASSRLYCCHLL